MNALCTCTCVHMSSWQERHHPRRDQNHRMRVCNQHCSFIAVHAVLYFQCTILRQVVVVMGAGIGESA
jgi:hypothetical protein